MPKADEGCSAIEQWPQEGAVGQGRTWDTDPRSIVSSLEQGFAIKSPSVCAEEVPEAA